MRRTSTMTLGFVLIFVGIQFNLVESYELTPRFSNFLSENGGMVAQQNGPDFLQPNQQYNSPYYQASFPNNTYPQNVTAITAGGLKKIALPKWFCWPVLFMGGVIFLHGFSKR